MPILPISIKFFPTNQKVVVVALVKNPKPNKLRVLKTANMVVKLGGDDVRSVTAGRGYIMDKDGPEIVKFVILTFRYANAIGEITEEYEDVDQKTFDSPAMLEITITNTPDSGDPEQALLALADPMPNGMGDPPMAGIDLFAE
jgi:hypothetical protein